MDKDPNNHHNDGFHITHLGFDGHYDLRCKNAPALDDIKAINNDNSFTTIISRHEIAQERVENAVVSEKNFIDHRFPLGMYVIK
jgi:hypothetical protein